MKIPMLPCYRLEIWDDPPGGFGHRPGNQKCHRIQRRLEKCFFTKMYKNVGKANGCSVGFFFVKCIWIFFGICLARKRKNVGCLGQKTNGCSVHFTQFKIEF